MNSGQGTGYESYTWDGDYDYKERTNAIRNTIHNEIVRQVDFIDRGEKESNLHVVRETQAPAILTENGFIDNEEDANKLKDDKFLVNLHKHMQME